MGAIVMAKVKSDVTVHRRYLVNIRITNFKLFDEFLTEKGFFYKNHTIEFKTFDAKNITWFDYKDMKIKTMYAGSRDIYFFEKVYDEKQRATEVAL